MVCLFVVVSKEAFRDKAPQFPQRWRGCHRSFGAGVLAHVRAAALVADDAAAFILVCCSRSRWCCCSSSCCRFALVLTQLSALMLARLLELRL